MCGVSSLWRLDKEVGGALKYPIQCKGFLNASWWDFVGPLPAEGAAQISRSPFRRFLIANGMRAVWIGRRGATSL